MSFRADGAALPADMLRTTTGTFAVLGLAAGLGCGRLDKLVLNGWDDRNQNQIVDWPGECAQLGTGPYREPMGKGGTTACPGSRPPSSPGARQLGDLHAKSALTRRAPPFRNSEF